MMEGYEFVSELQRLGSVCQLVAKIDLDAMIEHLRYMEQVAPFFEPVAVGHGSVRVKEARRFLAKAKEFKAAVIEYQAGPPLVDAVAIPEHASKPSQGA